MNPKIIAMYLPQFHRIPENDKWWGEGFTDWVSVKKAEPLFPGHKQPRKPLGSNYYDLSEKRNLKWQSDTAQKYGVDGWAIYHYWFADGKKLLEKPAEIILQNNDISIPFCFAWDNTSWIRTWSKIQGNPWSPKMDGDNIKENDNGLLLEIRYGKECDWKEHFDYLLPFFSDDRYIKVDGKPVFIFFTNNDKKNLIRMGYYWNKLAIKNGFNGVYLITRRTPFNRNKLFQGTIKYEPAYSGWQAGQIIKYILRVENKKKVTSQPVRMKYDSIWKSILRAEKKNKDKTSFAGGFVDFDDTPRKGGRGRVIEATTPEKFYTYLSKLYGMCKRREKEFIFITAWNEWGESATLEPDEQNEYSYLKAIEKVKKEYMGEQ